MCVWCVRAWADIGCLCVCRHLVQAGFVRHSRTYDVVLSAVRRPGRLHAPVANSRRAISRRRVAVEAPAKLRHRDVMWIAVLLCACATTATVTSSSARDDDSTPGQAWVDNLASRHSVEYAVTKFSHSAMFRSIFAVIACRRLISHSQTKQCVAFLLES